MTNVHVPLVSESWTLAKEKGPGNLYFETALPGRLFFLFENWGWGTEFCRNYPGVGDK